MKASRRVWLRVQKQDGEMYSHSMRGWKSLNLTLITAGGGHEGPESLRQLLHGASIKEPPLLMDSLQESAGRSCWCPVWPLCTRFTCVQSDSSSSLEGVCSVVRKRPGFVSWSGPNLSRTKLSQHARVLPNGGLFLEPKEESHACNTHHTCSPPRLYL